VLKLDCINNGIASNKAHLGSLGANEPLKALTSDEISSGDCAIKSSVGEHAKKAATSFLI
jgi:hypothetical protein